MPLSSSPETPALPQAGTSGWRSPARTLRDALEPIATICFWAEPAYDAYAAKGLDFLQGYVWGRASVLGEPEGTVVASAFGVFEPGLIAALYDSGRAACSARRRAGRARSPAPWPRCARCWAARTAWTWPSRALRRAAAAADLHGPADARRSASPCRGRTTRSVRLWHAASILREHRGDSHLATCVAHGLTGVEANLLTEMRVGWDPQAYTASRGWSPEAMDAATAVLTTRGLVADGVLTAEGAALRDGIEEATDRLLQPVVDAIGDDLPGLLEFLDGWSQQIVERGWFPPDPYKRASG